MDQELHDTPPVEPPVDPLLSSEGPPDGDDRRQMGRGVAFVAMALVALAIVAVMLAPGVHERRSDATPASSGSAAPQPEAAPPVNDAMQPGKPAPLQFTLKDMNGVDVKLASFTGKVILLNFWATWCGPCRAEIPSLVELQQQYNGDLVILGFSVDDPVEKLRPYAAQFKMNYPILVGTGREDVQDAYGPLWGIPVSVLIGRDGRVAVKHSGIATKEQFEREIKALL